MDASAVTQAVGGALPAALGIALSPIPIIGVILILGTSRARSGGPAFAFGWVFGLAVVGGLVLVITGWSGEASTAGSSTADSINWMKVGLGVVLLVLARKQWRRRPEPGTTPELPAWMAKIDEMAPARALGVGVLLSGVNPKNLILTLAAAASIAQVPDITTGEEVAALALFVAIASVTVIGAVVAYLVGGDRAAAFLAGVREYMTAHNSVIMMVILLLIGAKLIGDGTGALS